MLSSPTACVHPLPSSLDDLQRRQSCADLDTHWDQVEIMVRGRSPPQIWNAAQDVWTPNTLLGHGNRISIPRAVLA